MLARTLQPAIRLPHEQNQSWSLPAGGGFIPAFAQLCLFYYLVGALLHWGIPLLFPVQNVQPQPRAPWSVARDAIYSLGECIGTVH